MKPQLKNTSASFNSVAEVVDADLGRILIQSLNCYLCGHLISFIKSTHEANLENLNESIILQSVAWLKNDFNFIAMLYESFLFDILKIAMSGSNAIFKEYRVIFTLSLSLYKGSSTFEWEEFWTPIK